MHHYLTLLSLYPDNCARHDTDSKGPIIFSSIKHFIQEGDPNVDAHIPNVCVHPHLRKQPQLGWTEKQPPQPQDCNMDNVVTPP